MRCGKTVDTLDITEQRLELNEEHNSQYLGGKKEDKGQGKRVFITLAPFISVPGSLQALQRALLWAQVCRPPGGQSHQLTNVHPASFRGAPLMCWEEAVHLSCGGWWLPVVNATEKWLYFRVLHSERSQAQLSGEQCNAHAFSPYEQNHKEN